MWRAPVRVSSVRIGEADVSGAHASPAAVDGKEEAGCVGEEEGLLLGGEHEVAEALVLVGEGGEDAVVDAKVRGAHVGGFLRFGEGEGDAAEVCGGHAGYFKSMETMLALMRLAMVPASMARRPRLARSLRRLGTRAPMPPICMPIEPTLAKPQRAKVAIEKVRGDRAWL